MPPFHRKRSTKRSRCRVTEADAEVVRCRKHARRAAAQPIFLPRGSRLRVRVVDNEIVVEPVRPNRDASASAIKAKVSGSNAERVRHLVSAAGWSVDVRRVMTCGATASNDAVEDEVRHLKQLGFDVRKRECGRWYHACSACGHVCRDPETWRWTRCCDAWKPDQYDRADWMVMNARVM